MQLAVGTDMSFGCLSCYDNAQRLEDIEKMVPLLVNPAVIKSCEVCEGRY